MYDFSNDSQLLSSISQGYVGCTGNVMIRDTTAIPELVAKQPVEENGIPRKTSLQSRQKDKIQLTNRPGTAKGRLESGDNIRVRIRDLSPSAANLHQQVAMDKPSPGKPDLSPYKERFEVLPSYRPQIFPAKTYLTRQGHLLLYAVRDQRQDEYPAGGLCYPEYSSHRLRPASAIVKLKTTSNGQRNVRKNSKEVSSGSNELRPKSAPPSKVSIGEEPPHDGENSYKNRIKTDAEVLAEIKAEISAASSKKQNRPISAKKKRRVLSARRRRKVSATEQHNLPTESSFEDTTGSHGEVTSGMDPMRVDGRGGATNHSAKVDPRRAKMRELAEKRRLEMEAMRNQMRSQLIAKEEEVIISDNELDSLLVPDESSSILECELSVEEIDKKVSTHSLMSDDSSLTDLLANQLAEQKRQAELEAQRQALERKKREEELARLEIEAELLRESEKARILAELERKQIEELKRRKRLEDWMDYQDEMKKERFDSLTKAYWRANSCSGISHAYTFSYFQAAKIEKPRLNHSKKELR
ncbi:hypothetical protein LOD99_15794 [Oopsacas minuta]|uniref:Uncharacterized protein n=1 Tax=Oopsacas minuta TaxID=111878 RepID=A0AAV7KAL3_9METZ|nr:hypothetical protein LOD99_15794 [Oopsacas minuta]